MAKPLIRLGDMTTHGGKVINGFMDYTIQGIPVAGVGHMTVCPLCKGSFPIIQGYDGLTVNGIPVSLNGHSTACGAKLIASQMEEVVDEGGGGSSAIASQSKVTASIPQQIAYMAGEGESADTSNIKEYSFESLYQNRNFQITETSLTKLDKLFNKANALSSHSVTFKEQIKELATKGWKLEIAEGGGSYCNSTEKIIRLSASHMITAEDTVQTLAHEMGHAIAGMYGNSFVSRFRATVAQNQKDFDFLNSDEQAYIQYQMKKYGSEGDAIINNAIIRQEILNATEANINIGVSGEEDDNIKKVIENFLYERGVINPQFNTIQKQRNIAKYLSKQYVMSQPSGSKIDGTTYIDDYRRYYRKKHAEANYIKDNENIQSRIQELERQGTSINLEKEGICAEYNVLQAVYEKNRLFRKIIFDNQQRTDEDLKLYYGLDERMKDDSKRLTELQEQNKTKQVEWDEIDKQHQSALIEKQIRCEEYERQLLLIDEQMDSDIQQRLMLQEREQEQRSILQSEERQTRPTFEPITPTGSSSNPKGRKR